MAEFKTRIDEAGSALAMGSPSSPQASMSNALGAFQRLPSPDKVVNVSTNIVSTSKSSNTINIKINNDDHSTANAAVENVNYLP